MLFTPLVSPYVWNSGWKIEEREMRLRTLIVFQEAANPLQTQLQLFWRGTFSFSLCLAWALRKSWWEGDNSQLTVIITSIYCVFCWLQHSWVIAGSHGWLRCWSGSELWLTFRVIPIGIGSTSFPKCEEGYAVQSGAYIFIKERVIFGYEKTKFSALWSLF